MKKQTGILLSTLIIYLLFFQAFIDWDVKVQAVAALVIIQLLWMGRVFPLAFSSLLFILLLSFHFFSFEETLSYISYEIVWLLFATFIISHAFIETGLASRLSLKLMSASRGSGRGLIFICYGLMLLLSILIPSNIGKANLVTSVMDRVLKSLKGINNIDNLGKSLFIGVSYLTAITGAFVATGASSTLYTFGLFTDISNSINYMSWILYFSFPILLFLLTLWGIMICIFPPENIQRNHLRQLIEERLAELGPVKTSEKKVILIMSITLILWVSSSYHSFSIPLVGFLGAVLTLLPYIGVWEWNQAKKSINWEMMLFFASTLMVSGMLIQTGTVEWTASFFVRNLPSQSGLPVILLLMGGTLIIRVVFVNVLGFLTIIIPLAIQIGYNLEGFSPLAVGMTVFLTGIPGFFLITQSPVHLISYSYGYFTDRDLFKAGLPASLCWVLVILLSLLIFWRYI